MEINACQFYPEASATEAKVHEGLFSRRNGKVDLSSIRGSGFGYPRVAASFEYHAPLHLEEEFDVHLRIVKITRASMAYACAISRDGAPRLQVEFPNLSPGVQQDALCYVRRL